MPLLGFTLLFGFAPAPAEVVEAVRQIEIEAATDVASVCRLRLSIAQTALGDWSLLEKDLFRPLLPLSVRFLTGNGTPEAVFNGYLTHLNTSYSNEPGASTLEVTAMDVTHLMNLEDKVMPWPNLPDSAIAAAIFGQYRVVPRIQPTAPVLVEPEGTTTQRSSDIRFLRQLARRNGFECYVQPEPFTGIDQGFFQPPSAPSGPAQAVLTVGPSTESNVDGFQVDYELTRPTTAVAVGLDVSTKALQPALAPVSSLPPAGLEPTLLRELPPPIARPYDLSAMKRGELQTALQAIVDESSFAITAQGTVLGDVGVLRPGGLLNVRGAGRALSGTYYATRISHTIDRSGTHLQRFRARRNAIGMTGAELFVALP